MGLPNEVNSALIGAAAAGGYEIEQSLRLDGAAQLTRSPSAWGNRRTWTQSCWVKYSVPTGEGVLWMAGPGIYEKAAFKSGTPHDLNFVQYSGSYNYRLVTSQQFRDPGAWYHFVFISDTNNSTAADRKRLYVNGQRVTTWDTQTDAAFDFQGYWNYTDTHRIGADTNPFYFKGYVAEWHSIDGSALEPSRFGETDENGIWRPIEFEPTVVEQTPSYTSTYVSGMSNTDNPQYLFDGNFYTNAGRYISGAGTFSYSGSINTSGATTVRMALNFGANSGQVGGNTGIFYVNGTDVTNKAKSAGAYDGNGPTWIDITSEAGNAITSFSGTHVSGVSNAQIFAIDIDGVMVVDADNGYGPQGFYLKFDETAANGVGHDHSGNGNNWTASGITTTGDQRDTMTDSPTINHGTLNPVKNTESGFTYSEANLKIASPSAPPTDQVSGTCFSSGAWYAEAEVISVTSYVGVSALEAGVVDYQGGSPGNRKFGWTYYSSGSLRNNGSEVSSSLATYTTGDVIGFACNVDGSSLRVYKNGTLQYTATLTRTEPMTFGVEQNAGSGASGSFFVNYGQQPFQYTPPSGHEALSTKTIPTPTIKNPEEHFNQVLYTGNGSTQSITGVGFQPDFIWCKTRNSSSKHTLTDAVRGADRQLWTSMTDPEQTNSTQFITSFDSDGFTSGPSTSGTGSTNENNGTFVAWCWKAGNGTSSNTDGSVTSTVSVNQTAGFSIVSWTGTGANATVGHGLGKAPKFIIIKNRDEYTSWAVYVKGDTYGSGYMDGTRYLNLDATASAGTNSIYWNDTDPTSTVFTVGTRDEVNNSADKMIAYCWTDIPGYSSFGCYQGNGSDDGAFLALGFKPAWIMIKSAINTADDWIIMDNKRSPINVMNDHLVVQQASTEVSNSTETNMDFLSNGVKLRDSNGKINAAGSTYVYAAFADEPFGGAGITPATAK